MLNLCLDEELQCVNGGFKMNDQTGNSCTDVFRRMPPINTPRNKYGLPKPIFQTL